MVFPSPFIFQMGRLMPKRGKNLLNNTQPARGQAGSLMSLGLCLAGAPVRVETLPGSSQESKVGGYAGRGVGVGIVSVAW